VYPTAAYAELVIHAGRMVDVEMLEVLEERSIVVEGERIVEVVEDYRDGDESWVGVQP
jgi:adenine deaminase|tara:strand:+ start:1788 stop:1961 length:174 start_codon:yes stop_codon:yes gene_type:complete